MLSIHPFLVYTLLQTMTLPTVKLTNILTIVKAINLPLFILRMAPGCNTLASLVSRKDIT